MDAPSLMFGHWYNTKDTPPPDPGIYSVSRYICTTLKDEKAVPLNYVHTTINGEHFFVWSTPSGVPVEEPLSYMPYPTIDIETRNKAIGR